MKKWKKIIGAVAGIMIVLATVFVYQREKAALHSVERMGNGINLGNSLDATNLKEFNPKKNELDYEISWHNPPIDKKTFEAIHEAGLNTVRIPVTWEEHMDADGNISEVWMNRVQEVVDMALAEDLYVIINTHHEEWLDLHPDQETEMTERLRKVWLQIAERFEEYDEKLIFEGMNEPRLRGSEHEWDGGTPEMQQMVNRLNHAFVQAVRSAGGENTDRYLMISTCASVSFKEALETLEVPEGHIIVSVHAYLPYNFCQNEEGTPQWDRNNPEDTREIEEAFETMESLFVKKDVPVILSEFGCKDKGNLKDRVEWLKFHMELAEKYGICCLWWDNGSSYQLLDRTTGEWTNPELVELLR